MVVAHWQEGVVALLLVLCAGYIAKKGYLFFKKAGASQNPCEGCISDCKLRDSYSKKGESCPEKQANEQKKNN